MVLPRFEKNPATPPAQLAVYERYADAQRSVDLLSDRGFPVRHVSIVWNRLRRVEHVTGRRTPLKAAAEGAVSGVWIGTVIGLLLALFVELDPDVSEIGLILWYAGAGALVGAVILGLGHLARRGTRDFSALDRLDAESFELWVQPEHLDDALRILASGRQGVETADRTQRNRGPAKA